MKYRVNIVETLFRETAALRGKVVLVEGARAVTNGELAAAVAARARELADRGVRPLDRVAFLCPDGIDYVVLSLAILSLDAAVIPLAPNLMSDERGALLEKMDVHHVLAEAGCAAAPAGAALRAGGDLARGFALTTRGARLPIPEGYAVLRPAFIRFSSGTTGASKGVVLSHEAIVERTDAADKGLRITSDDVVGWVLSMSFHFVVTILLFLRRGATIVLCGDPMPGALADTLQRRAVTVLYASPIHYRLLTLADALTPARFASVRLAISTAVKLPEAIARAFHERFGLRLTEAYGIIEVGLPFIHCPPGGAHDGGLGRPLPDYTVRLGAEDEVLIRGKGMFDAYFSPWQPRAVCQPDGWFHTGDVGEWTADGGLRLVGRRKAVINFSGMKLFPQEIEEVLNRHPAIAESLVYGESHPEYGQIPCARIVLREGAAIDDAALLGFCRERLALHKIPKTFTRVPALEKTASGKIRRSGVGAGPV